MISDFIVAAMETFPLREAKTCVWIPITNYLPIQLIHVINVVFNKKKIIICPNDWSCYEWNMERNILLSLINFLFISCSSFRRGSRKFFQGGGQPWRLTVEVHKYEKLLIFSFPVKSAILSFANSRGVRTPPPPPPSRSAHVFHL